MAFIQTRQRDYVAAKQTLKRLRTIDGSANSEPFVLATEGLAEYQNGNFTLGDAKYATAVRLFIERRDFHVAAFCKLNQALFAEDTKHQDLSAIANETVELLEKYGSSDCFMLLKIRQSSSIEAPEQSEPMKRRLSQWVFDSEKNTLFQKEGITSIGAPGFVALPTKK